MARKYSERLYEPKLPLTRENGLLERCSEQWENIPVIQLFTKSNWWGNAINTEQIGGMFADAEDSPIQADGEVLKTLAQYAKKDLSYFTKNEISSSLDVSVSYPSTDTVEIKIEIVPVDAQKSYVPYVQYQKPETVIFWLSTMNDSTFVLNTLDSDTKLLSTLGGVTE